MDGKRPEGTGSLQSSSIVITFIHKHKLLIATALKVCCVASAI